MGEEAGGGGCGAGWGGGLVFVGSACVWLPDVSVISIELTKLSVFALECRHAAQARPYSELSINL